MNRACTVEIFNIPNRSISVCSDKNYRNLTHLPRLINEHLWTLEPLVPFLNSIELLRKVFFNVTSSSTQIWSLNIYNNTLHHHGYIKLDFNFEFFLHSQYMFLTTLNSIHSFSQLLSKQICHIIIFEGISLINSHS